MKTIRDSLFCFLALFLLAPLLRGQELAKYRGISIGTSLSTVLKQTVQKPADVKVLYQKPAMIQELTWWPPLLPGSSYKADSVREIVFAFQNGELYKMTVSYERSAVEGLTDEDMVKSISSKYGPPASNLAATTNEHPQAELKIFATWEDPQFSFNLFRSFYTDGYGLIIYSKRLNGEATVAVAQAIKLEAEQGPQQEFDRQKKEVDDLETARQKNLKSFHP